MVGTSVSNAQKIVLPSTTSTRGNTQTMPIVANAFYKSVWFWIACGLSTGWIVSLWMIQRKKSVSGIEKKLPTQPVSESNDKFFEQACQSGQALQAQQFILSWAKKYWPDTPLNLTTLRELITDQTFQIALQDLEHALYAKKKSSWNGETLFVTFQKIKKSRKGFATNIKHTNETQLQKDPLPPLHPSG